MPDRRWWARALAVPINTAASSPATTTVVLQAGTLCRVEILIPFGHAGLTGVAVRAGPHRVVPTEGVDWLVADDDVPSFEMERELVEPFEATIEGYNTDDTYSHSFYVRLCVEATPAGRDLFVPPPARALVLGESVG